MSEISLRVKTGAALLDVKVPDWATKIDLSTLQMKSACRCILGQIYGDYYTGEAALNLLDDEMQVVGSGFDLTWREIDDFDLLQAAWVAEIKKRLETAHAV